MQPRHCCLQFCMRSTGFVPARNSIQHDDGWAPLEEDPVVRPCWKRLCSWGVALGFLCGILIGASAATVIVLRVMSGGSASPMPSPTGNGTFTGCQAKADVLVLLAQPAAFNTANDNCGRTCLGQSDCAAKCIADQTSVSVPCAVCYGNHIGCGTQHCTEPCFFGPSPGCTACVNANCRAPLWACVGIPTNLLP